MPRIPSEDESVAAVRVHVTRSGGTRRLCLRLPTDSELTTHIESGSIDRLGVDDGTVVRLIIDRRTCYARIGGDSNGRVICGAFVNRRLARTPGEGDNVLAEWIRANGREDGDPVILDVVVSGDAYGVRLPGERTVYDVDAGPRGSLADIASSLDE